MDGGVKINNVWRRPSDVWAKIDGVWRLSKEVYGKIDGRWRASLIYDVWITKSEWNLLTGRSWTASAGTQDATLVFGGSISRGYTDTTEKFNGSSWSSTGKLSDTIGGQGGCGTQSAALSFGGTNGKYFQRKTYKFNGSTWSTTGNLSQYKFRMAGCGAQNAALCIGGELEDSFFPISKTEKFNGSSWSTTKNLTQGTSEFPACGTLNAALCWGGYIYRVRTVRTNKFNGSSWVTDPAWNYHIDIRSQGGCGVQDAALSAGGYPPSKDCGKFNGTTWKAGGKLNIARYYNVGAGTMMAGLTTGGSSSKRSTEKYMSRGY